MEKEYSQKYLQISRLQNRGVIFDAEEAPFLSVKPELSILEKNERVKDQFKRTFPSLTFDRACLADGAIIIQDLTPTIDTSIFQTKVAELNNAANLTLQIVDGQELTRDLIGQLTTQNPLVPKQTILLPGTGAQTVAKQIQNVSPNLLKSVYGLPTKRTMLKPGQFDLEIDYTNIPDISSVQSVLIIDDVVASGQTTTTIADELLRRNSKLSIDVATWIYLWPTDKINKQSPSGIRSITNTTASIALKGNYYGRPPINSLSCLLMEDPLSEQKTNIYVDKYARDPYKFRQILKDLKEYI